MYTEGCGFRSIARALRRIFSIEINYQLAIYWIKKFGRAVEEKAATLSNSQVIPILELDELYSYIQKKRIKSGIAVDRNRLRFASFEAGDGSAEIFKKLWNRIKINEIGDGNPTYSEVLTLENVRHLVSYAILN